MVLFSIQSTPSNLPARPAVFVEWLPLVPPFAAGHVVGGEPLAGGNARMFRCFVSVFASFAHSAFLPALGNLYNISWECACGVRLGSQLLVRHFLSLFCKARKWRHTCSHFSRLGTLGTAEAKWRSQDFFIKMVQRGRTCRRLARRSFAG